MKTSFIATVLNEEKSIGALLKSLYNQTKLPDEVIIVDAGSTDKTIKKISEFVIPLNAPAIKLIFKKGNRSIGRNEGIRRAKGEIVLISDAGCSLDKNWVKNILKPFNDKKIAVSSGYYHPLCKNIFQKCLATYTSVMEDKINSKQFLPSSRSVAFRKSAWGKIGGYPENLDTCEDLMFAKKLKEAGLMFEFVKEAFVYWPQENSFLKAFKQFFHYAKGDGQAHYIRQQTPFLFARYLIGLMFILYFFLWESNVSLLLLLLLFACYLIWSIYKNYKYVKNKKALYFLPLLQLISDIAVLTGMAYGYLKTLRLFSRENIWLTIVCAMYSVLMLSVIKWGIPNINHPFNYHMDEWHQLQTIRNIINYGTNNMPGSANGPMFQFILSGVFLLPFYFLKIVNPFAITSLTSNLNIQETLFIILRLNTLIFGILSIGYLAKVIKRSLKINPIFPIVLFTFSPIWLSLCNYFKYDIALIFWLILSIFMTIKFIREPILKNFLVASFVSSLAVSTKISALPLILILLIAYLLVYNQIKMKIKTISLAILVFTITFLILGIPDIVFLHKGSYYEYFFSNLVLGPSLAINYSLGMSWLTYLLTVQYPITFGIAFYFFFLVSLIYLIGKIFRQMILRKKIDKIAVFLLASLFIFFFSLLSIKIEGRGNRSLVLLPYMAFIVGYFYKFTKEKMRKITYALVTVLIFIQLIQSSDFIKIKLQKDTREISSTWIVKNIKISNLIGLENVPIYQQIPDILLKDYYQGQKYGKSSYSYSVINFKTQKLPSVVVVTNSDFENTRVKESDKNKLVKKLITDGYRIRTSFVNSYAISEKIFKHEDIFFTGLIPMPKIVIYEK